MYPGWDSIVLAAAFLPLIYLQPQAAYFQMKRKYNFQVYGDRFSKYYAIYRSSRQVVTDKHTLLFIIGLYNFFPLSKLLLYGLPGLNFKNLCYSYFCRSIQIRKNINIKEDEYLFCKFDVRPKRF